MRSIIFKRNSTVQSVFSLRRYVHSKVTTLDEAMKHVQPGQTILSGGFGCCGIPDTFLTEIAKRPELKNLTVASNNGGAPGYGVDRIITNQQVSKMIMSYIGARGKETLRQYMSGELDIELVPQGTLAERARAGATGIGAFFTRTGVNTWVEQGKMPYRHHNGKVVKYSEKKETREIDGVKYIMEYPLKGDVALVHAAKADKLGNLWFRGSTANFNQLFAKAAAVTLVEADEIVEVGELKPNDIHVPGIHVDKIVQSTVPKHIEVLKLSEPADSSSDEGESARVKIAKRAAMELKNGSYCNLGVGLPTLIPNYLPDGISVTLESENGILGVGSYPATKEEADPDLVNAGKETCTFLPGGSAFPSDESFGMIRAGKLDACVLGAIEVSQFGDLANWGLPGRIFGTGGAMDLVSNPDETRVIVTTTHTDKKGNPKIVTECANPLTGARCVSLIVTELAVFEVDREHGLTLVDVQAGSSVEEIKAKTGAPFRVALKDSPKL